MTEVPNACEKKNVLRDLNCRSTHNYPMSGIPILHGTIGRKTAVKQSIIIAKFVGLSSPRQHKIGLHIPVQTIVILCGD